MTERQRLIVLALLARPDRPRLDSSATLYGFQSADPLMPLWKALGLVPREEESGDV